MNMDMNNSNGRPKRKNRKSPDLTAAVDVDVDVNMDMDVKERNRKEALEKGNFWALGGLFLLALLVQCTTIGNHGAGLGGLLLKVTNSNGNGNGNGSGAPDIVAHAPAAPG
eukprot:805746_1